MELLKVRNYVGGDGLMRLHLQYIPDSSPPSQRKVIIFQRFPTCLRHSMRSRLEVEKLRPELSQDELRDLFQNVCRNRSGLQLYMVSLD